MAIACDRCKKIIENYDIAEHDINIFDKCVKPDTLICHSGLVLNNKCKTVVLCDECQDELDFIMAKFMSRKKIIIDICDLL